MRKPKLLQGLMERLESRQLLAGTVLTGTGQNLNASMGVGLTFDGDGEFIDSAPVVDMAIEVTTKSRVNLTFSATPGTYVNTDQYNDFGKDAALQAVCTPQQLAASTVYRLFADTNGNEALDAGDSPLTSFTRNTTQLDLNAGTYFIRVDPGQTVATNRFGNPTQIRTTATATINAKATATLGPKIGVKGNGVTIADNDAAPIGTDGTDFGTATVGAASVSKSFVVTNTGDATLNLGAISKPAGFTVQTPLPPTLAAGASATFKIAMPTAAAGNFAGAISFTTNDPAIPTFNFNIKGVVQSAAPVLAPKAIVKGNGITIADGDIAPQTGDGTDFGTAGTGTTLAKSFVVSNTGNATLSLTNMGVPAGFTVVQALPATLAAGASATFTIGLLTSTVGDFAGTLSFKTNDASVGNYSFNIKGEVELLNIPGPPTFAQLQGNALVVTGTDGRDVIGVDIKNGFVRAGLKGGELLSFPAASVASIVVSAGAASDKITIETTLTLPATLNGGTGKDVLLGGSGNDYLSGQGSNDKLVGRLGADTLDGGDGVDLVEYTDRVVNSQPVNASLDGVANDGGVGEGDFILDNVENLLGGRGNDTLTGNDGPNILAGSRGADQLFGLGGDDILFAFGESNPVDGLADILDGGDDTDTAVSDGLDTLLNIP